ncbi:MAG: O-antigen polymerase [Thermomicrobiales bacterium]
MKADTHIARDQMRVATTREAAFPVLWILWIATACVGYGAFLLRLSDSLIIIAFASIIATIPLLGLRIKPLRWFHPMVMVAVPAIVGIGLRSVYLLYDRKSDGASRLLLGQNPEDVVVLGSLLAAVGLSALTMTFVFAQSKSGSGRKLWFGMNWQEDSGRSITLLLVSLMIGVVATVFYVRATGGFSWDAISGKRYIELSNDSVSSGAFISRATSIPALACLPILSSWAKGSTPSVGVRILVIVCIGASTVAPFIASSRAEIIALLVVCGITWSFSRTMSVAALVAVSIVALGVLLTMGSLRCEHQSGASETCGVEKEVEGSLLANENWLSVSKTYHIARKVPDVVGFQYGSTILGAMLAPIPRTIWESKPSVRSDILVGFQILELPPTRRTGASPGFIGELYLNLGLPAVVLGMGAMGYALRRLWDWLYETRSDFAISVFALAAVHIALRLPQGDFTGSMLPFLQGAFVVGAVLWFGQRPIKGVTDSPG